MSKIYISLLSFGIALSVSISGFSQKTEFIKPVIYETNSTMISHLGEPNVKATETRTLKVTISTLREGLKNIPFDELKKSNTIYELEIPHVDGTNHKYTVERNTTMHPDLAAKYPEIATFNVINVRNPSEFGKIDITPKGFHAMIFSPDESTMFIDPYNSSTDEYYSIYLKENLTEQPEFECQHESHSNEEVDFFGSAAAFGSCDLRTYRLALACTGEYANNHGSNTTNNDKSKALAAQVTTMNRVNGVYEKTLSITMEIIPNNDLIIFLNASTDPYSNNNGGTMLGQNQTTCDNIIGTANYDIGHVFSTGGGGIASLGSVCSSSRKAQGVTGSSSPKGDTFDIDYVAHEMGHQFGGNHTQSNNCQRNINTSVEPGSASTILGYAGICTPNVQSNSDDYFHGVTIQEMGTFITSSGHTCPVKTTLSNNAPVISSTTGNITIPRNTPFVLKAEATDADGDVLLYQWEEMDKQKSSDPYPMAPRNTSDGGPMFRSFDPTTSPMRYFPNLNDLRKSTAPKWEVLPNVKRTMKFRVVVSDVNSQGSCNTHRDITVAVDTNTGPFLVTHPNTNITWNRDATESVTWDVANTDLSPINCAEVNLYLSTDGGITFPNVLATNVVNDGEHTITVPNLPTTVARVMVMCSNQHFFDISNVNFTISSAVSTIENQKTNFRVYPNPTNEDLNIVTENVLPTDLTLTDMTGKVVFEGVLMNGKTTINLSNYTTGVYLLHLKNTNESRVVKVVKK
ncbi:MAG: reprolysin-like metallopeptidase [Bacteroidia bacterium]